MSSTTYTIEFVGGDRPWALVAEGDGGTEVVSVHPSRPSAYRRAVKRAHEDAAGARALARYTAAYEADRARVAEWHGAAAG